MSGRVGSAKSNHNHSIDVSDIRAYRVDRNKHRPLTGQNRLESYRRKVKARVDEEKKQETVAALPFDDLSRYTQMTDAEKAPYTAKAAKLKSPVNAKTLTSKGKRPPNGFNMFTRELRKRDGIDNRRLMTIASQEWSEMSDVEKRKYTAKAAKLKGVYSGLDVRPEPKPPKAKAAKPKTEMLNICLAFVRSNGPVKGSGEEPFKEAELMEIALLVFHNTASKSANVQAAGLEDMQVETVIRNGFRLFQCDDIIKSLNMDPRTFAVESHKLWKRASTSLRDHYVAEATKDKDWIILKKDKIHAHTLF